MHNYDLRLAALWPSLSRILKGYSLPAYLLLIMIRTFSTQIRGLISSCLDGSGEHAYSGACGTGGYGLGVVSCRSPCYHCIHSFVITLALVIATLYHFGSKNQSSDGVPFLLFFFF